jgi:sulfite reductase (ferredoxin)
MNLDDLETTFEPVFRFFQAECQSGESFGDFCNRVGIDSIQFTQMRRHSSIN